MHRWEGKTADPRGQGPHKRAFFTETPLFWTIVVRAIREHPKEAFEALKHWIHDDELMQILTGNTDEAVGDTGSESVPEVDEVQDAVPAPATGAVRPRKACADAAAPCNTRPQKKQKQKPARSVQVCSFGEHGERCGHVKGEGVCTREQWKTLPRVRVPSGQTWEVVDPEKVKAKVADINTERKKCGIKSVVARRLADDKKTVLNLEAIVNDAKRQLRVCGCHLVYGTLPTHGPKHAARPAKTPSKGTASERSKNRCNGEQGQAFEDLLTELAAVRAELAATKVALAEANARTDRATQGFKYSNVQNTHRYERVSPHDLRVFCGPSHRDLIPNYHVLPWLRSWWHRNTHFSCRRHFDMFIDFLTDGNPEKLRELHVYNDAYYKLGKGYNMPANRGRNGDPDFRTELMMYFAFEVTKESAELFFDSFSMFNSYGMCLIRTYAMLMHEFAEAFGRILSWQEQAVMMPTQWREWFGLDQATVDESRPWDPAAVDVETKFANGGRLRRPSVTDTTNIPLSGQPRSQEAQAQCFNRYYNGWVAKAAVCALPLGWVYAPRLMAGGVGDSVFLMRSGIAKMQRKQAQSDAGPPFLIVADKGNRQHASLWKCGEQTLITPTFSRKGISFSSLAMLQNVCVARLRIFNECVIARVKMARFGVAQHWRLDAQLVELLWRNYVFRCNAVYMPYSRGVLVDSRERVLRFARAAYHAERGANGPEASS